MHETQQPSNQPTTASPVAEPHPPSKNPRMLIAFGALVALLLVVLFVLPNWVKNREPLLISDSPATTQTAASPPPAKPLESPWTDAQLAKERRETQDILAQLLNAQEQLQKQDVEKWAAPAYEHALKTAEAGDGFYRARQFAEAKQSYNNTLQQFKNIAASANTVLEQQLLDGAQALEDGNAERAIAAFTLALKIDSSREAAQNGLQRANVLTDVLALIEQGQTEEQANHLDAAKTLYLRAQNLDSASPLAAQQVQQINTKILQRDFTEAMSAGYQALAQQNYAKARQQFKQALTLKPADPSAEQALAQAANQQQQFTINTMLKQAQEQEAQEQWAEAVQTYKAILKLDNNIVGAKVGEIRSQTRQELADNISQIINDPTRLQSDKMYQYGQQLLADLRSIRAPGPVAKTQIQDLSHVLTLARTPVNVQLKSDAQTRVTLYRVGELGLFTQHSVQLTPGKYTLVGTRDGYRDVRKDFVIPTRDRVDQPTIVIQCEEKITNG